jgi:hypothetical protein
VRGDLLQRQRRRIRLVNRVPGAPQPLHHIGFHLGSIAPCLSPRNVGHSERVES